MSGLCVKSSSTGCQTRRNPNPKLNPDFSQKPWHFVYPVVDKKFEGRWFLYTIAIQRVEEYDSFILTQNESIMQKASLKPQSVCMFSQLASITV